MTTVIDMFVQYQNGHELSAKLSKGNEMSIASGTTGGLHLRHAVSVRRVSKVFGDFQAVCDASFDLPKGRFLTILGPSGSGKTTLLRMIAGFDAPTSGDIHINGEPVNSVPPHKRAIGMVFQRLALFPHMTAAENVAFPLKMRRHDARTIPARVERYLELVRLGGSRATPHSRIVGRAAAARRHRARTCLRTRSFAPR